ncbi:MAG: flavodoxin family protein [Symbiobacteriaceae bacterium]|nr:flavodoxin family protein [Symbiobacteriaceae bacterium]
MKIVVITGSPHARGTSALLAERFIAGAEAAGNEITRFDAAFAQVAPCLGCDHCREDGTLYQCVQVDDMPKLNPALLAAELIVFVTPLYYFGMSAQIKTVIDRFYAYNSKLRSGKRTMLLATAADDEESCIEALVAHYRTLIGYMQWQDGGILTALGVAVRADMEGSAYPEQAYAMGVKLAEQ